MTIPLRIPDKGHLDFLALGALIHRLDPGIVPFRKASSCTIHVSGGEFNTAANLSDCFGLRTGIATAMVEYPIGELIAGRVRSMGVTPFYKMFKHDGAWGPNMAAVLRKLKQVGGTAVIAATLEIFGMGWVGYELAGLFGWSTT